MTSGDTSPQESSGSEHSTRVVLDGPVVSVPVDTLIPHPRNARMGDIGAIVESIRAHGLYRPLVVQRSTNTVLAGNHTLAAVKALEWTEVPVQYVDVTDDEGLRILLVDNRTNDLASYDDAALAELLTDLATASEAALAGTGFTGDDLDQLLRDLESSVEFPPTGMTAKDEAPDTPPSPLPENPVTQRGDLWVIGGHQVLCGDSRDADDVARVLDGASIAVSVTSPPYAEQRVYDQSSGFQPIPPDEYVEWYAPVAANIAAHLADGGSSFVNIKPSVSGDGLDTLLYVFDLVLAHVREWGWHFATEFCWERNGVPKNVRRRFKNQFEPIYQFTRDDWVDRFFPDDVRHWSDHAVKPFGPGAGNTSWGDGGGNGGRFAPQGQGGAPVGDIPQERGRAVQLGLLRRTASRKHGSRGGPDDHTQGNPDGWEPGEFVGPGWAYPGNRLPTFAGSHEATGHSAAFPVGLPQFFVKAYSEPGDVIYDPFLGSGSTVLAAHNEARVGIGIEISPAYCDVAVARIQRHTGFTPTRNGEPHDFGVG